MEKAFNILARTWTSQIEVGPRCLAFNMFSPNIYLSISSLVASYGDVQCCQRRSEARAWGARRSEACVCAL